MFIRFYIFFNYSTLHGTTGHPANSNTFRNNQLTHSCEMKLFYVRKDFFCCKLNTETFKVFKFHALPRQNLVLQLMHAKNSEINGISDKLASNKWITPETRVNENLNIWQFFSCISYAIFGTELSICSNFGIFDILSRKTCEIGRASFMLHSVFSWVYFSRNICYIASYYYFGWQKKNLYNEKKFHDNVIILIILIYQCKQIDIVFIWNFAIFHIKICYNAKYQIELRQFDMLRCSFLLAPSLVRMLELHMYGCCRKLAIQILEEEVAQVAYLRVFSTVCGQ